MALEQEINPQPITKTAYKLRVDTVLFNFGEYDSYATASIALLDENNLFVNSQYVSFTQEELAGWGNDDTFVIDLVKTKLNLA